MSWKPNKAPEYELTEPGIYQGVISQIINLGLQEGYQGGADKEQIFIGFEFEGGRENGLNRMGRVLTNSFHGKSALMQILTGLYGKAPGEDWAFEELLQAQCQLQIKHEAKKDGTGDRALIAAVLPPAKGQNIVANLSIFAPTQKDVHENREDLPDWLVEKAMGGFMRLQQSELNQRAMQEAEERKQQELEEDEIPWA